MKLWSRRRRRIEASRRRTEEARRRAASLDAQWPRVRAHARFAEWQLQENHLAQRIEAAFKR